MSSPPSNGNLENSKLPSTTTKSTASSSTNKNKSKPSNSNQSSAKKLNSKNPTTKNQRESTAKNSSANSAMATASINNNNGNMNNSDDLDRQISSSPNYCVICCHETDLFCLGQCDHPICFECGVRMRVICESNDCPICRSEIVTMFVVDSTRLVTYSKYDQERNLLSETEFKKYNLKFEHREAANAVKDILAHVCTMCPNEPEFRNFDELSQHMRRAHELFYCDLCASNLQLFSWERKCYRRDELARHRRVGDPDDRSHRGHPLCEFCDERYMDDEVLYRHLRRDHFFCHYCDADGMNKFYPSAPELKKHLKSDHFLCEEGQCKNEPFGISFRHDIDFKAHKANVHGSKQERIVNVNFDIRRGINNNGHQGGEHHRPMRGGDQTAAAQHSGGGSRGGRGGTTSGGGNSGPTKMTRDRRPDHHRKRGDSPESDDPDLQRAMEVSKSNPFAMKTEEFPTLGGAMKNSTNSQKPKTKSSSMADYVANAAGLSTKAGSLDRLEEFPSLPLSARGETKAKKKAEKEQQQQTQDQQRMRRNSRSASPVKRNRNFVMVDDDEEFPSVSEELRKSQEAARQKAAEEEEERKRRAKENERIKQLRSNPTWVSSSTKKQHGGDSKSTAWDTRDEAFPMLGGGNGGNGGGGGGLGGSPKKSSSTSKQQQQQQKSNLAQTPWSQLLAVEKKEPKKEISTTTNKKKKSEVKSPSSMATDALLEALPAGLPIKSKARRIAQQKQRPSESEEGAGYELEGLPLKEETIAPPPGFEISDKSLVAPPPGFESSNHAAAIDHHPQSSSTSSSTNHQYKRPQEFEQRNHGLFARLRALMNNDETRIQEFKKSSSQFRRGETNADEYCQKIHYLLQDDGSYLRIFAELVCLLPDIRKQNELWRAFQTSASAIDGGSGGSDSIKKCPKCEQLLVKMDYYDHVQTAHVVMASNYGKGRRGQADEEYPALS